MPRPKGLKDNKPRIRRTKAEMSQTTKPPIPIPTPIPKLQSNEPSLESIFNESKKEIHSEFSAKAAQPPGPSSASGPGAAPQPSELVPYFSLGFQAFGNYRKEKTGFEGWTIPAFEADPLAIATDSCMQLYFPGLASKDPKIAALVSLCLSATFIFGSRLIGERNFLNERKRRESASDKTKPANPSHENSGGADRPGGNGDAKPSDAPSKRGGVFEIPKVTDVFGGC